MPQIDMKAWNGIAPQRDFPEYNLYCDESCHLENDGKKAMALVSVVVPKGMARSVSREITEIKERHGVSRTTEVKWTKASPARISLYKELVDYFFDNDALCARGLVVQDKSKLRHEEYGQSHEDWYYRMYYYMLKPVLDKNGSFYIYIDVKDTNSGIRANKLQEVCANAEHDFDRTVVRRIQPIRSDEVQVMQIVDILAGALTYRNNWEGDRFPVDGAKASLVARVAERSGLDLTSSTPLGTDKLNLFFWNAEYRGR